MVLKYIAPNTDRTILCKIINETAPYTIKSPPSGTIITYKHTVWVAFYGNEIVGMLAYKRELVHLPEEPPKEIICVDTLCAKDDIVYTKLISKIPTIPYPTGRGPRGSPPGYTSRYNRELEGDPIGLELPPPIITSDRMVYIASSFQL